MFHKPFMLLCCFSSEVQRETLLFSCPSLIKYMKSTNIALVVQLRSDIPEKAATEKSVSCPMCRVKCTASVWYLTELNQIK